MGWTERIKSINSELSELKDQASFDDQDLGELVRSLIEKGTVPEDSALSGEQIDTLYRFAWWLEVGTESVIGDTSRVDASWVADPVGALSDGAISVSELFDSLVEIEQNKQDGDEDVVDLVLRAARELEDLSGSELRESVANAVHNADQAGTDAASFNRALMHLYNYLPNLLDGLVQTVESYRRGDLDEAAEMLPLLTEGIEWSVKGLLSSQEYLQKWGIEVDAEEFNEIFEEVVDALEQRDSVYLPDLFEHELFPLFYEYHKRIEEVLTLSGITDTLLEENLSVMPAVNEDAAEAIRSTSEQAEQIDVEIGRADDGSRSLRVSNKNGRYYLCSPYNPGLEANQWVEIQTEDRVYPIVVLFGFGLGYRIRELVSSLPDDFSMLVVEPSPALMRTVLNTVNAADILEDPRIRFLVGEFDHFQDEFERMVNWKNVGQLMVQPLPNYPPLFPEKYAEFTDRVKKAMSVPKGMRATHYMRSRSWVINTIKNLPYLFTERSTAELEDSFKGKPAIIVAAGPSLDKNIHLLEEAKDKAFIIAVDTALQILQHHDIEPDMVITIDPGANNFNQHLKGRDYDDVPLAAMYRSYHKILEEHGGRKFLLTDRSDLKIVGNLLHDADISFQMTMFPGGGSVAHWAMSLAKLVGADPIIFTGQDLAYTGDSNYAKGVEAKRETHEPSSDDFLHENIHGEEVVTAHQWYVFLTQFEKMIGLDESGRTYIDATEGGLKIEGTQIKTLRETLDEHCTHNIHVQETLDEVWNNSEPVPMSKIPDLIEVLEETEDALDEFDEKLERAQNLSDELDDIYQKEPEQLTRDERERADDILDELHEIDTELDNSRRLALLYLTTNAISDFVNNLYVDYRHRKEENRDPALIAKISKFLYDSLAKSFDFARPLLEETKQELDEFEIDIDEFEDDSDEPEHLYASNE